MSFHPLPLVTVRIWEFCCSSSLQSSCKEFIMEQNEWLFISFVCKLKLCLLMILHSTTLVECFIFAMEKLTYFLTAICFIDHIRLPSCGAPHALDFIPKIPVRVFTQRLGHSRGCELLLVLHHPAGHSLVIGSCSCHDCMKPTIEVFRSPPTDSARRPHLLWVASHAQTILPWFSSFDKGCRILLLRRQPPSLGCSSGRESLGVVCIRTGCSEEPRWGHPGHPGLLEDDACTAVSLLQRPWTRLALQRNYSRCFLQSSNLHLHSVQAKRGSDRINSDHHACLHTETQHHLNHSTQWNGQ